jgi:hypothetical protein
MSTPQILVSFFQGGIKNTKDVQHVPLEWALDHIRDGKEYEPRIRELRAETDKKKKQEIKKGLSYFIFSGTFQERNAAALLQHSGLLVLDFDNVSDLVITRLQLQEDPYCLALFRSPGGDGLKFLVKIEPEKHLETFKALEAYFLATYGMEVDKSGKDVCRACYTSADSSLYYNPDAQPFYVVYEEVDEETGEVITIERPQKPEKQGPKAKEARKMSDQEYAELIVNRVCDARLDFTTNYDDWQMLAFSMASLGESGREYFHRLSAFYPAYDHQEADQKFTNALKSTRFTSPGWFLRKAKQSGVDMKYPQNTDSAPLPAKKAEKPKKVELEPEEDGYISFEWPKKVHFQDKKEREEAEKTVRIYRHFTYKNRIYFASFKIEGEETRVTFKSVSNFNLIGYYVVNDEEGKANRIIEVINTRGETMLCMVPTEAFTSVQEFSKFIEKGNYVPNITKPEFTWIKSKIYDDCKSCRYISTLGQQPEGFFAFANGIFADGKFHKTDKMGVVEYKEKHYFLPANSIMFKDQSKLFQFERNFVYEPRKINFEIWAELFCKVYGENGRIALLFFCMSCFSDFVFKIEGFFPILFLYGKPESGKTTLAVSLMSLFQSTGEKTVGININNVPQPALFRVLAQVKNGLVLIEEYQNDLEKFKLENLKGIWNRTPPTKTDTSQSNTSNRTVSTPPESAAIITGQHLPNQDVALFTRCILLSFFKLETYTEEQEAFYRELKSLQAASLSEVTTHVLRNRELFINDFKKHFEKEKRALAGTFSGANVNRVGAHAAQILAAYHSLNPVLKMPFTEGQLRETVLKTFTEQVSMMVSSEETSTFWDIVQQLYFQSKVSDTDDFYIESKSSLKVRSGTNKKEDLVEFGDTIQVLFLSLKRVHGLYLNEMRTQGRKNAMDKTSLTNYLINSKQYIGHKDSYRFGNSVTSAYCFNYSLLKAAGIVLEKINTPGESRPGEIAESAGLAPQNVAPLPSATEPDVF